MFNIGSKDARFKGDAIVKLWGDRNEPTISIEDQGVSAGSKVIANIGIVQFYGQLRKNKMARLKAPAKAGDSTITIDAPANYDFKEGDRIALAPTDMFETTHDTRTITKFDKGTGVITVDKALEWYHFGAAASTFTKYGVDMRGEVLLLSRNIKIIGEELDLWGCQILTADVWEFDPNAVNEDE
jgi:hypothetical protein